MAKIKKIPQIDFPLCMACGCCVAACPFSALEAKKIDVDAYKKAYPLVDIDRCTGCSLCVKSCPVDVITMVDPS